MMLNLWYRGKMLNLNFNNGTDSNGNWINFGINAAISKTKLLVKRISLWYSHLWVCPLWSSWCWWRGRVCLASDSRTPPPVPLRDEYSEGAGWSQGALKIQTKHALLSNVCHSTQRNHVTSFVNINNYVTATALSWKKSSQRHASQDQ